MLSVLRPEFKMIAVDERLPTLDAKIIEEHSHRTIGVDCNVQGLVNRKVVVWTLTDNVEPVDERLGKLPIYERPRKARRRKASCLIAKTSSFAGTADTLWLKLLSPTKVVAVDSKRKQHVQRAA